jgi:hypothetical protein
MPKTSFNNWLAQRPKGKQKRFIIESLDSGVFVSQAHNDKQNVASLHFACRARGWPPIPLK